MIPEHTESLPSRLLEYFFGTCDLHDYALIDCLFTIGVLNLFSVISLVTVDTVSLLEYFTIILESSAIIVFSRVIEVAHSPNVVTSLLKR